MSGTPEDSPDRTARRQEPDTERFGILDLVEATGLPRRTIRFYVQRGLLAPPLGAGRGHFYRREHLERIARIRDLQAQGKSLEEIRASLGVGEPVPAGARPAAPFDGAAGAPQEAAEPPAIERAVRVRLAPGVELLISGGAAALSPARLRALAIAAARILADPR